MKHKLEQDKEARREAEEWAREHLSQQPVEEEFDDLYQVESRIEELEQLEEEVGDGLDATDPAWHKRSEIRDRLFDLWEYESKLRLERSRVPRRDPPRRDPKGGIESEQNDQEQGQNQDQGQQTEKARERTEGRAQGETQSEVQKVVQKIRSGEGALAYSSLDGDKRSQVWRRLSQDRQKSLVQGLMRLDREDAGTEREYLALSREERSLVRDLQDVTGRDEESARKTLKSLSEDAQDVIERAKRINEALPSKGSREALQNVAEKAKASFENEKGKGQGKGQGQSQSRGYGGQSM